MDTRELEEYNSSFGVRKNRFEGVCVCLLRQSDKIDTGHWGQGESIKLIAIM